MRTRIWTPSDNPLRDPRDRRLPEIAGPCSLVIFGVTGDLARKKLMPAVYDLANRGLLPPGFALVGFARRDWADQDFAQIVHDSVREHARTEFREDVWQELCKGIRFVAGDFADDGRLRHSSSRPSLDLDRVRGTQGNHAFYLSIPPKFFGDVVQQLKRSGLSVSADGAWRRVVIEKPFGHDLASARELNATIGEVFPSGSVFRIDHYLGKETVQNLLALRFANTMFEPIWNANYVDHVQITMAEDIGIGGRAGYYDGIGAARDVIQNHLLQLLALTAMEEPLSFAAKRRAHREGEGARRAHAPEGPRRGHRARAVRRRVAGRRPGHRVPRGGRHLAATSTTETFAAVRLEVDTRRWAGVPFYLRTGKRLGRRVTELAVVFKRAPHLPFSATDTEELGQNAFVVRIQPDEGVTMRFGSKVPGTQMEVRDVNMDFAYGDSFTESSPEAYERLILDVLLGDPPLFPRHEEVELGWKRARPDPRALGRPAASPTSTSRAPGDRSRPYDMLARDGRTWRRP